MHSIKKSIIGVLGVIGIVAATHASGVITIPSSITNIFNNTNSVINAIHFNRWGNNFQWVVIWWSWIDLGLSPQTVNYGPDTISCQLRISGLYYNNQRWARRWPLDRWTQGALAGIDNSYNDIQLTGWLFTYCTGPGADLNAVYGQITHTLTGTLSGEYKLAAGLVYDFNNNAYNNTWFTGSLLWWTNTTTNSWYIYDSAGGIWILSNATIQTGNNNTGWNSGNGWWGGWGGGGWGGWFISNTTTSGSSNSGSTIQISTPTTKLCHYDDVPYAANGPFQDTLGHRGFDYIEILRISCINQGRWRAKGKWEYQPNAKITRAEVLKTVTKILGSTFDNFSIINEKQIYTWAKPFVDTPNWFNHYADFAFKQWLTDGLYTTDKDGKKYLNPDEHITRYEAIKIMMLAYNKITQSMTNVSGPSVMGDIVNPNDPYYSYVRQAEVLWFISGVPQKNGSYSFEGIRDLTRAEFAKIIGLPFADQLFDIEQIIFQSEVYNDIIDALNTTTTNKKVFIQAFYEQISAMSEMSFIKKYKVPKQLFLETLYETVVAPILGNYTWPANNQ